MINKLHHSTLICTSVPFFLKCKTSVTRYTHIYIKTSQFFKLENTFKALKWLQLFSNEKVPRFLTVFVDNCKIP